MSAEDAEDYYAQGWEDCAEALAPLVALAAKLDPIRARLLAELARGAGPARCRERLALLPHQVDREAG